jgi:hypothetical protein
MDGFLSDGVHDNDHLGTLDAVGAPSTPSACAQLRHCLSSAKPLA